MLLTKTKIVVLIICYFLMSCDARIAENKEPIFNSFKPESKEYRNKLAELITNKQEEFSYVFWNYTDDETIEIIVSGNSFAAHCIVKVYDWKGMEGIKQSKGGGYRYAALEGLQLEVRNLGSPKGETFVYKSVDSIID